jgi:DNA-binding XRE family transcriptional regulator
MRTVKAGHPDFDLAQRAARIMKEARIKKGLSQRAVAEHLGISRTTLSGLENGKLVPHVHEWFFFCRLVGISCDVLFEDAPKG